jgi:maleate isomerase
MDGKTAVNQGTTAYPQPVKGTMSSKRLSISAADSSAGLERGIGLIAPFDFALDSECWRWLPPETSLYVTRTPLIEDTAVTISLAKDVSGEAAVTPAVKSLLFARPAVVAYACTSGSFVDGLAGERTLRLAMEKAGAPVAVTTSGALVEALKQVKAHKIAIATPYNESLTFLLAHYLEQAGFEVVSSGYLDMEEGIMGVGYEGVRQLAAAVDVPEADTIFFSCTNLRTFDIIEELEQKLGKTILSANQVTMWAALQAAGLPMPDLPQRLFRKS